MGGRSTGTPHYNRASWFGVGEGFFRKARRCPARGSDTAAAMALRAACSGLQITESKQKQNKKRRRPTALICDDLMPLCNDSVRQRRATTRSRSRADRGISAEGQESGTRGYCMCVAVPRAAGLCVAVGAGWCVVCAGIFPPPMDCFLFPPPKGYFPSRGMFPSHLDFEGVALRRPNPLLIG